MEITKPPPPADALRAHRRTARSRLAFYAAVSVRGTELPDGVMELAYHLHTIGGPGQRLQTVLLGTDPGGCTHLTCNLKAALELVSTVERQVLDEHEEDPGTQLTFPW